MNDASSATTALHAAVLEALPFDDTADLTNARRGYLAASPDMVTTAEGGPVWDTRKFDFVTGDAPAAMHPSLWRQEQLNGISGLFEVVDGIYQVRSLDLSNISFVPGESGWIVLDPVITAEVAAAALELVNTDTDRRPVTAVVYSHSHADHFGGVGGVCTPEDVAAGSGRRGAGQDHLDGHLARADRRRRRHLLELSNGVLHHRPANDDDLAVAGSTITTSRAWLHRVPTGCPAAGVGTVTRPRESSPRSRATSTAPRRPSTPSLP